MKIERYIKLINKGWYIWLLKLLYRIYYFKNRFDNFLDNLFNNDFVLGKLYNCYQTKEMLCVGAVHNYYQYALKNKKYRMRLQNGYDDTLLIEFDKYKLVRLELKEG